MLVVICYCPIAYAQKTIELLSIAGQFSAPQKYDSIQYSNEEATERAFNVQLTIPIVLSDSNIWYSKIYYDDY